MTTLVLRVRLVGGDHMDVTYEETGTAAEEELTEHVVSTLTSDSGCCAPSTGTGWSCCTGRGRRPGGVAARSSALTGWSRAAAQRGSVGREPTTRH